MGRLISDRMCLTETTSDVAKPQVIINYVGKRITNKICLRCAFQRATFKYKYVLHPFSCALCSNPPLPPPSLKGKGTSTQALCSTYFLFKSGPLVKLNQLSYFSKSRLFISLSILDVLYYYFFGI